MWLINKHENLKLELNKFLPTRVLKTIYDSLILSRFNFHMLAWGHEWAKFEVLQKNTVRAVTKKFYNHHSKPLFHSLKTLTLENMYQLCLVKFYHDFKNCELPSYFLNFKLVTNHDISVSNMTTRHGATYLYPSLLTKTLEYRIINLVNSDVLKLPLDFNTRSKSSLVSDLKSKFHVAYSNWSCSDVECRPCTLCYNKNCCSRA